MTHIDIKDVAPELRHYAKIARYAPNPYLSPTVLRLKLFRERFKRGRWPEDLNVEQTVIPRPDGSPLRLVVARPQTPKPLATGVLWLHGGGYLVGLPESDFSFMRDILAATNAVIVAPDYRRSSTAPFPAALNDAYLALQWLHGSAAALGVNPNQLFVGGESAGGGLAAALSFYARDQHEIPIAFQTPLYPMLDDRPTASSRDNDAPIWDTVNNQAAWQKYLGDLYGTADISPYAAPARATSFAGLPPTYSYVGSIEPFYAETLTYIKNLRDAGGIARADVYPGAFHGFDLVAPNSQIAKLARTNFRNALRYAADHYFTDDQS